MEKKTKGRVKLAVIAVFFVAAGFFYCCSGESARKIPLNQEETNTLEQVNVQAEAQKEALGETQAENQEETAAGAKETQTASRAPEIYVHVSGRVKQPGVYVMPEGSRIFEAIEKAGGAIDQEDLALLNLAQTAVDGMKIHVMSREEARTQGGLELGLGLVTENGEHPKGKININQAGQQELMTLTGIGAARAKDIISYREKHGGFNKIEDIMKVSGIKEAAFEKIREEITTGR